MTKKERKGLSRRERQIMDIVYQRREATVSEVLAGLEDPPSYSAVRATMGLMVEKEHLKVRRRGQAYVYSPTVPPSQVRGKELRHLLETLFRGSESQAVAAILGMPETRISNEEYRRLSELLKKARKGKGAS